MSATPVGYGSFGGLRRKSVTLLCVLLASTTAMGITVYVDSYSVHEWTKHVDSVGPISMIITGDSVDNILDEVQEISGIESAEIIEYSGGTIINLNDSRIEEGWNYAEYCNLGIPSEDYMTEFQGAYEFNSGRMPETVDEIASFAKVMKEFCNKINPKVEGTLIDTCGTGGDKLKTFNISTIAAFVVAGAGIPVAKHGNRSVTSKCGSADILEAMGVNLNLNPKQVEKTIENVGIGFMFAPLFHPAMKNVQSVRKELAIRTIFNTLGPLTNPANAEAQLIGVYSKNLGFKVANALISVSELLVCASTFRALSI